MSVPKTILPTELKSVLEKARIENGIQGMSVAILYKGELLFAEGLGKRNDKDPFTKDVCFLSLSLSLSLHMLCVAVFSLTF